MLAAGWPRVNQQYGVLDCMANFMLALAYPNLRPAAMDTWPMTSPGTCSCQNSKAAHRNSEKHWPSSTGAPSEGRWERRAVPLPIK